MLYLACPAPFSACRRQGGGRAAGTKHQARQGAAGGRGHQPGRVACRTGQSVGTFMRGMPCETARERSQLTTPGGPWKGRDAGRILTHCVASARLPPPTRRHRLRTHPDAHQPWRGARRQRACGLTHVTGGADGTARSCEERCAGSAGAPTEQLACLLGATIGSWPMFTGAAAPGVMQQPPGANSCQSRAASHTSALRTAVTSAQRSSPSTRKSRNQGLYAATTASTCSCKMPATAAGQAAGAAQNLRTSGRRRELRVGKSHRSIPQHHTLPAHPTALVGHQAWCRQPGGEPAPPAVPAAAPPHLGQAGSHQECRTSTFLHLRAVCCQRVLPAGCLLPSRQTAAAALVALPPPAVLAAPSQLQDMRRQPHVAAKAGTTRIPSSTTHQAKTATPDSSSKRQRACALVCRQPLRHAVQCRVGLC